LSNGDSPKIDIKIGAPENVVPQQKKLPEKFVYSAG
jgi:hypothetical protein